jgi:hypothetical protein
MLITQLTSDISHDQGAIRQRCIRKIGSIKMKIPKDRFLRRNLLSLRYDPKKEEWDLLRPLCFAAPNIFEPMPMQPKVFRQMTLFIVSLSVI